MSKRTREALAHLLEEGLVVNSVHGLMAARELMPDGVSRGHHYTLRRVGAEIDPYAATPGADPATKTAPLQFVYLGAAECAQAFLEEDTKDRAK